MAKNNGYMWQKTAEAIDALLWTDDPERVRFAFHALMLLRPSECELDDDTACQNWETVQRYVNRPGSGADKAADMSFEEKREFTRALWELHGYLSMVEWGSKRA
jgi:hypothetical protein